jgi:hypothetical protein
MTKVYRTLRVAPSGEGSAARAANWRWRVTCDSPHGNAILGQIEIGAGAVPGAGGAMEAILGADDLQAEMAERYGWINRALPDADLDAFELVMPGADAIRADARRFHQLVISDAAQARTAALFMPGLAFLQLVLATLRDCWRYFTISPRLAPPNPC